MACTHNPQSDGASRPRGTGIAVGLIAAIMAAGCAPAGDFGRPKQSFLSETVLPEVRGFVRKVRGVMSSRFELSDDEREMRALSYSLLNPAERASLPKTLSRALDDGGFSGSYYERRRRVEHMAGTPPYEASGPTRRDDTLISLIRSDTYLMRRFAAVADRVYRADAIRRRSLARGRDLAGGDILDTTARIEENRQVAADTLLAMENRVEDYRVDLRRSVLEYPQTRERYVSRLIRRLSLAVDELRSQLKWRTRPERIASAKARRAGAGRAEPGGMPELLGGPAK